MILKVIFITIFGVALCNAKVRKVDIEKHPVCNRRNAYYPVDSSCDAYILCTDFRAEEMLCPDGLHFNTKAQFPDYPCGYPAEVKCKHGSFMQKAIRSKECPHLHGYFRSPLTSSTNCGHYRVCVFGKSHDMVCPPGLAFNSAKDRCEFAESVASCDVDAFIGFKCPEVPYEAADMTINYKHPRDCHSFFSCEHGRARLLSCDSGLAFDQTTGRCENADSVVCAH